MAEPQRTSLAARLTGLTSETRTSALKLVHPLHSLYSTTWETLLDAYEGAGGFHDGGYLWKYRREDAVDYNERKANARYHNFAKAIVGVYVRYVMGHGITRKTKDPALEAWWQDVDAAGMAIDGFMPRALKLALAAGHEGILVDKTPDNPTGPSKADEIAIPFLTLYQPQSILDWRSVRHELVGLKLAEAPPAVDILEPLDTSEDAKNYLLWTQEEWARFNRKGELIADGFHNLGVIPFVKLMPEPSALYPDIGQSLIGDAHIHKALYNRCAEEDEVLRAQSFSVFVINANSVDDVERIKSQFPSEVGTTRAVVTAGSAEYVTPDQMVPEAIRKNTSWLIQEVYRAAHLRFQRDSLDAESAEAIRLQHAELNEMLTGTAQACQQAEEQIVRHYYGWTSATPEQADAAFDKAEVAIEYPDEFFLRELLTELEEISAAIALDLGQTFTKRLKTKLVRRMDPDLDDETLKKIDGEIEAQEEADPKVAAREQMLANTQARMGAFGQPAPGEVAA